MEARAVFSCYENLIGHALTRMTSLRECITSREIPAEEEILHDPTSLKLWLRYIVDRHNSYAYGKDPRPLILLYERACKELPGSYKLWKMYLDFRLSLLKGLNPAKHIKEHEKTNACFDRALVLLHKMPRIWTDYLEFLMQQSCITKTRRTFNAALQALPLTQQHRIWKLYNPWAASVGGDTAHCVARRYLQINPQSIEDYLVLLEELEEHAEAIKLYVRVLDDPNFRSKERKSQYQLWSEFCELLVRHPRDAGTLDVEAIIRAGLRKFTDQKGRLWTSLATYWITLGDMEHARDIFEEGVTSVETVRDFAQIFDAYSEFEEYMISRKMEEATARAKAGKIDQSADIELDIRMARFEQLMDRRPFLVNDVLLRQNPHNVIEWEKRVGLWGDNKTQVVETYTKAIKTINPKKATGKFQLLWRNFAAFYEKHKDMASARKILEKATRVPYRSVNELAELYCEWAEMELRNDAFDQALLIMKKATECPKRSTVSYFDDTLTPQARLHKSSKIWMFYVDLVESVSTMEETRAVYDRIFELRIATPQTVVNYANMLEEAGYYEESFKIFERGVDLFAYPVAFELWNLYLSKFLKRYGGKKLERARDLFEQALLNCPPKFAKPLYLMYAIDLEEKHGLLRNSMRILDRACSAVDDKNKMEMFQLYIAKSASTFGVTSTRPIYERALEELPDAEARDIALQFAQTEAKLSEIDRARAILGHGSQFANPVTSQAYWDAWHDFEVKHGNEDTYATMLQVKRSVAGSYSTDANYIANQIALAQQGQQTQADAEMRDLEVELDPMTSLEKKTLTGFVSGGVQGAKLDEPAAEPENINPDQIELDDDDL